MVAGKFVVAPEARLEIDVSDFDIKAAKALPLLRYSSIEGEFDSERVVLTGCKPQSVVLRVTEKGITLRRNSGFSMSIR